VVHVAGKVDPLSDIETIHTELALADLQSVEKQLAKSEKVAKTGGDKDAQRLVAVLEKAQAALDQGKPARTVDWAKQERAVLEPLFLLTMKPTLYVANVSEHGFEANPMLAAIAQCAASEGAQSVAISAAIEAQIADLPEEDKKVFLADMGMEEPGLNRFIRAGYKLLGLETFFTAGPKEVRAWTLHIGQSAAEAAGSIHTDFERGFIRAEVIACEDYIACGGEQGAKAAGKMRLEGRDYVVQDGDVIYFRIAV
jgi:hypothetical protein